MELQSGWAEKIPFRLCAVLANIRKRTKKGGAMIEKIFEEQEKVEEMCFYAGTMKTILFLFFLLFWCDIGISQRLNVLVDAGYYPLAWGD